MNDCKTCTTCFKENESLNIDIYPVKHPRKDLCDEDILIKTILPDGRKVKFESYKGEEQMTEIMALMRKELSEPYSIYTYRYFIYCWPELCILAMDSTTNSVIGAIVGKLDQRQSEDINLSRSQEKSFKNMGIGTILARAIIRAMVNRGCDEIFTYVELKSELIDHMKKPINSEINYLKRDILIVLEAEASNNTSLALYARLGFIRESRLFRYYMSGSDAFRLKLYLSQTSRVENNELKKGPSDVTAELISTVFIKDDLCEKDKQQELI